MKNSDVHKINPVAQNKNPQAITSVRVASPPASYRSLSGPKSPKSLKKVSRSPGAPGVPKSLEKVSKKSEKSGKSLENVCAGLFRDFFQTFGAGDLFFRLFGISGPEGPRDSCSSWRVRKVRACTTMLSGNPVGNNFVDDRTMTSTKPTKKALYYSNVSCFNGLASSNIHLSWPLIYHCDRLFYIINSKPTLMSAWHALQQRNNCMTRETARNQLCDARIYYITLVPHPPQRCICNLCCEKHFVRRTFVPHLCLSS